MRGVDKKIDDWLNRTNKKGLIVVLSLLAFLLLFITAMDALIFRADTPRIVGIDEFYDDLKAGKVDTVYYHNQEEIMRYTVLNSDTAEMTMTERLDYKYPKSNWRQTIYPGSTEVDFRREMTEKYHVNAVVRTFRPALSIVWSGIAMLGSTLLMFIVVISLMSRHMTPDKKFNAVSEDTDTRFKDVIGQNEVLRDLEFIVDMMRSKKKLDTFDARVPKGILLSGPPGTGKTLIARAVAGEAGVPFYSANASEFIDLYVGMGARTVRSLFRQARKSAPCIIFIDEIDAVASKRGATGTTSEDNKTVNALLQEMDGFDKTSGIFVIAATNNPDALDEAIVRAGRFDRQVVVSPPRDWTIRKKLFEKYIGTAPTSADIESIARQTVGFTGADIDAIVNEAKLTAAMDGKPSIDTECFEIAIDKKVFKANRSDKKAINKDLEIAAYHEAGHAVMTYISGLPIARASIAGSVSGVGGAVFQADRADSGKLTSKIDYEKQIMIAYAGRAAEKIKFGAENISDGAASDITQATNLIYAYICRAGMGATGILDYEMVKAIDPLAMPIAEMERLSRMLMDKAESAIGKDYSKVEAVAKALLDKETLSGDEIAKIIDSTGGRYDGD